MTIDPTIDVHGEMTITCKPHKSLKRQNIHNSSFFTQIVYEWKRNMQGGGGGGRSVRNIYVQGRRGQKASQHGT